MIDLSKATKGCVVHFRNGGESVISKIVLTNGQKSFSIWFNSDGGNISYWPEGNCQLERHSLDIIKITPPSFNWDDVKPGYSFLDSSDNEILRYIGPSLHHKTAKVFERTKFKSEYISCHIEELTRAPEHDI